MVNFDIAFVLLHLSTILVLFLFVQILKKKHKSQIHYIFICFMVSLLIWCFGAIGQVYMRSININLVKYFEYFVYIGASPLPVFMLLLGLIFAHTKIKLSWKYLLLFIVPAVSIIMVWTNDYHHLFYKSFSAMTGEAVQGKYMIVYLIYTYALILLSLFYLIYFAIKNSGFFSKQAILIIIGTLVPLVVNMLFATKVIKFSLFATPIAFSFAIICFMFSILKYQFLSVVPVALQKVVDLISDSFVVISEELNVIDYNKTFIGTFGEIFKIRRNENIIDILKSNPAVDFAADDFNRAISEAKESRKSTRFEKQIESETYHKYFTVEITPIISDNSFIGTIILLKDITQEKKNIETIKEKQAILMEQERLASLGQLIGGIAHNLKTPIMSLAGGIEALKDLTFEYRDSIGDQSVTGQDHKEIVKEMLTWLEKMKPYCAYMSDVITAVKGQAVQMNDSTSVKFTVDELVKRVELLMKHELKKYHCLLKVDTQTDMSTEIKGEVNNLVQVFDNIIINAMHAYEDKNGIIELNITRSGNNVEFMIKDYAKGIPKDISSKLFKEMITTKGKNGTGLGLYMSYSTIKGRFGGNMYFSSKEGSGTTFYISIPCITYGSMEVSQ